MTGIFELRSDSSTLDHEICCWSPYRLILHRQLCWVQFLFWGVFCGEVTLLVIGDGVCGLLEVGRLALVSLPDLAALG